MTSTQIWIFVASLVVLVAIAAFVMWKSWRIPWPSGHRMSRTAALGNEVVVIDAPGSDGQRLLLLDACVRATTAMFTAWHAWRISAAVGLEPTFSDAVDAVEAFPLIGVHFIDDTVMDDKEHLLFHGEKIAAYLSDASSSCKQVPLAVIRKSLAAEMIATGQPLMHEMLHALLSRYLPSAAGLRDHTHVTWELVQGAARSTYLDLYAPKSAKP